MPSVCLFCMREFMNLNGHGCYINTNPTRFRRHAWLPLYVEKDIKAASQLS